MTVSYGRADLLKKSLTALLAHYDLPVIVIDGSPSGSECNKYVKGLSHPKITNITTEYNIGHGKGIDLGMNFVRTDKVLIFDTDTEIVKPGVIELMLEQMGIAYGIGEIQSVNRNGVNVPNGIPYLHPYFCIIDGFQYHRYPPACHHGAPFIKIMRAKPVLASFPVHEYVKHEWKGTRSIKPPEFLVNWEN